MPNFKTKPVKLPISPDDFICATCTHSGLYTEDGFMGHYAVTCKLLEFNRGEYERIVEPDSPNEDGSFDLVNECDSYEKDEYAIYKNLFWFKE